MRGLAAIGSMPVRLNYKPNLMTIKKFIFQDYMSGKLKAEYATSYSEAQDLVGPRFRLFAIIK
jgi:hypothetical protein